MEKPQLLPYPRRLRPLKGCLAVPERGWESRIVAVQGTDAPAHPDGYRLEITTHGIRISHHDRGGLFAARATLRQLKRQYGNPLPCLSISDWPDFARRGVMLDVSRGRVPNLATLLDLVERLADFKINEFQLYTEHTFAYHKYRSVWHDWGALTAAEIRALDQRCRDLGIDLVPNQNSFGHLRYLLAHPKLKQLAEVSSPYEGSTGDFLRYPTTLAPGNPGTIQLLRDLYDELLPNFSSGYFNVGCDETWDLGRGQSRIRCEHLGKGRVYLEFLKRIHREVTRRGKAMMFWGDIVLNHPELIAELPPNTVALNWGYEADHPFQREAARFARHGVPFYVCPGTATWMSLVGRHDTAFANLQSAAAAGRRFKARGYLNTDWGDGGHPQPLAVSWPLYVLGASLSWCASMHDDRLLAPVLSRDVYSDTTGLIARAALALGSAHKRFGYFEANVTPYGAVIAAPPPKLRELVCRSGLKYYARIPARKVLSAWDELRRNQAQLAKAKPFTAPGKILHHELDLAARMAGESCRYMLWQQKLASRGRAAKQIARQGITSLERIKTEFNALWSMRNKATSKHCAAFLDWRMEDYRTGTLHFSPAEAKREIRKIYAAE